MYDLDFQPTAMSPDGRVVAGNERDSTQADIWESGAPATVLAIGDLEVAGVGDQGSIVVGTRQGLLACPETTGAAAARWNGGFQDLGALTGGDEWSVATGVSADGEVVVGTSGAGVPCERAAGGPVIRELGFWTRGQSVDAVGPVPGDSRSRTLAVSTSGTTALGISLAGESEAGRLFVQSMMKGMLAVTPTLPPVVLLDKGEIEVDAGVIGAYISADGSVVAGTLVDDAHTSTPLAWHAFRWTQAGGLVMLAPTPDASYAAAVGLSADGATVIGYESSAIPDLFSGRAIGVSWTAAGVEKLLTKEATSPYIVNAAATTIVGGNVTPTVWRGAGAGVPGIPLFASAPLFAARCASPIVTAISDDGLTFAGSCATGPSGFVAQSVAR